VHCVLLGIIIDLYYIQPCGLVVFLSQENGYDPKLRTRSFLPEVACLDRLYDAILSGHLGEYVDKLLSIGCLCIESSGSHPLGTSQYDTFRQHDSLDCLMSLFGRTGLVAYCIRYLSSQVVRRSKGNM